MIRFTLGKLNLKGNILRRENGQKLQPVSYEGERQSIKSVKPHRKTDLSSKLSKKEKHTNRALTSETVTGKENYIQKALM